MKRCLLDLLEREKNCETLINRAEDRIALLEAEIEHMTEAYKPSELRDCDIAATQRRIDHEVDAIAQVRADLDNIRDEMQEYLERVLKRRVKL